LWLPHDAGLCNKLEYGSRGDNPPWRTTYKSFPEPSLEEIAAWAPAMRARRRTYYIYGKRGDALLGLALVAVALTGLLGVLLLGWGGAQGGLL
jgi:hypothetical protein